MICSTEIEEEKKNKLLQRKLQHHSMRTDSREKQNPPAWSFGLRLSAARAPGSLFEELQHKETLQLKEKRKTQF